MNILAWSVWYFKSLSEMFPMKSSGFVEAVFLLAVCFFIPTCICRFYENFLPKENTCNSGPSHLYRNASCGECGPPITVTLVARNWLVEPQFEFNSTVTGQPQRELIHVLEWAADQEERFRFSGTYKGRLGFTIDSINKLTRSREAFWHILSVSAGTGFEEGVSHYIPNNGEIILFNFTARAAPSLSKEDPSSDVKAP